MTACVYLKTVVFIAHEIFVYRTQNLRLLNTTFVFNAVSSFLYVVLFTCAPPLFGVVPIKIFMNLGPTDLRKGASKAKFDAGADFEVKSAVDPRKHCEKLVFRSKNPRQKIFF